MKRILASLAMLPLSAVFAATVNVNTAQQSELQRVKGLDKVAAKRIIEFRAQNGDYRTLDDLAKVIDGGTLEKVKPQLALAGDPYVPPAKPEKPEKKKSRKES
jgi:competence protein ComEA